MKVHIKNWHAVASWTWTTEDDVCGICHMALDGCAPGAVGPGDDSPVVWGRVIRTLCRSPRGPATRPRAQSQCPPLKMTWFTGALGKSSLTDLLLAFGVLVAPLRLLVASA